MADDRTARYVHALHLLIGRIHLDLAFVRPLTAAEIALIEDTDRWYRNRKADRG